MGLDVKRFVQSPFYTKFATAGRHARRRSGSWRQKTGLNPERDVDQVLIAGRPDQGQRRRAS